MLAVAAKGRLHKKRKARGGGWVGGGGGGVGGGWGGDQLMILGGATKRMLCHLGITVDALLLHALLHVLHGTVLALHV